MDGWMMVQLLKLLLMTLGFRRPAEANSSRDECRQEGVDLDYFEHHDGLERIAFYPYQIRAIHNVFPSKVRPLPLLPHVQPNLIASQLHLLQDRQGYALSALVLYFLRY